MSKVIDIPGGQATLRDPDELRGRDQNLVQAAALAAAPVFRKLGDKAFEESKDENEEDFLAGMPDLTRSEAQILLELKECVAVALLKSWTLPLPLPTADTIGDLDAPLYKALVDAAGGVPADKLMGTDFGSVTDPTSPPMASESFNGPSEAAVERLPIPESSPAIESTDTVSSTLD